MAYNGDALASLNPLIPRDNDPESTLGQVIRDLKAGLKDWVQSEHYLTGKHIRPFSTSTNIGNDYTVTLPFNLLSFDTGFYFMFLPSASNTGASTITVVTSSTTLGPVAIKVRGANLTPGMLLENYPALVVYNGNNFLLVNPPTSTVVTGVGNGVLINYLSRQPNKTFSNNTSFVELGSISVPANNYTYIGVEAVVVAEGDKVGGGGATWHDARVLQDSSQIYLIEGFSYQNNSGFKTSVSIPLSINLNGGQSSSMTIFVQGRIRSSPTPQKTMRLDSLNLYGY